MNSSLQLLLTLLLLGASQIQSSAQIQKPNVILIFADDLGFGDLSCYGHPTIHTPHLDRMAHDGIKLTSFYAAASVCSPSRAGLMTGRYPLRAGLPGNLGPGSEGGLALDERTLAEALRSNGYRTAAFGKWHLGSVPGYMPTDRGFDRYLGILYSNDMMPPWVNTDRPLHLYRDDLPTAEQPVDQTTLTRRYTDEAIAFIKERSEKPFFIYLPHAMPHLPVYSSREFVGRSAGGRYGDVVEEIDFNVGRILSTLGELGLDDQTIVIFTSDNGPWRNMPPRMFETEPVEKWHGGTTGPLRGAKATSYEGGYRVPCIIRWPGQIPDQQVSAQLVSALDIHATILSITQTKSPERPLDGQSVWPMLAGRGNPMNRFYFYFTGRRLDGVRDQIWKLRVATPASNWQSPELQRGKTLPVILELFNLRDDPFEQFNRAEDYPDQVERLREVMKEFASNIGAQTLTPE